MKKVFFILLFTCVTLSLGSCEKDDAPNFHFVPLSIVSAELPEFFSLDQTYTIRVTFNRPDSCTNFSGFDVISKESAVRNVVVIGTNHYDQEGCTQALIEETNVFNFKVIHNETYTFRFWQGEDAEGNQEYFEVLVPVR
jgi:hypothetical protein